MIGLCAVEVVQHWTVLQPLVDELRRDSPLTASIILSPLFALLLGVAALTLIAVGLGEIRKNKKDIPPPAAGTMNTNTATATGNAFTQHQHFYPPQSQAPEKQERPFPRPNLVVTEITQEPLFYTGNIYLRNSPQDFPQKKCGVAKIVNEPFRRDISPACGVKAEIVFIGQEKQELGRSSPTSWLGQLGHLADIPPAEAKELLLYTFAEDHKSLVRVTNRDAKTPKSGGILWGLDHEFVESDFQIAHIEIRLVTSTGMHLGTWVVPCHKIDGQLIFGKAFPLAAEGS